MFACLFVFKCLLVCFLYWDGLLPNAAGRGGDVRGILGIVGSCKAGLPGASITPERRHPGRCHGGRLLQKFCSRLGGVLRSYALEVEKERETGGCAVSPIWRSRRGGKGCRMLPSPGALRAAAAGPRDVPRPPPASGGCRLRDPRVLPELEPRPATSLGVAPPGRPRVSANPEISRKGSLRPRGCFGHARRVDLLVPGRARSRVGQARLPGLHLLHSAFLLTLCVPSFSLALTSSRNYFLPPPA